MARVRAALRHAAISTLALRAAACALAAASLILSGCTPWREYLGNGFKVGPNYRKPPAPVAQDWIDAADQRVHTDDSDLSEWWRVFRDPTLDALVANATEQNLTLREAGFRVLQVRAARAIAIGEFFPQQQDAFGAYSRNGVSFGTPFTSILPERFFSQWTTGFSLAWELDFWGRFRRAIEAADADLDASVENYDQVVVTLLGDVASTYVEIRVLQRQLALVQANVQLQRETLTLVDARFRGGQVSELDVDQATSNLAQTEALGPELEIRLREATNRLCVLLGIPPQEMQSILGSGVVPTAPADVAVGIPVELLTRRPDVRRAEREVAAQSAQIGIAMADLYPQIGFSGTVAWSSQQFNNLFSSNTFNGTVGPSFQWNLLNYGRIVNNVRLQDMRLQELIAKYQHTVLRANAEAEDGIVRFLRSQQQARFMGESVAAAERATSIALTQYKAGLIDFNRVSLLQQDLVEQQDKLVKSHGQIARGLIETYRALGGGWQVRLAPTGSVPIPPSPPAPPPKIIWQLDAQPANHPGASSAAPTTPMMLPAPAGAATPAAAGPRLLDQANSLLPLPAIVAPYDRPFDHQPAETMAAAHWGP